MISVLQRVSSARVDVEGQTVGAIGPGLLVLVCAEQGDTAAQGEKLLAKILKLRIFSDGNRPSFNGAAAHTGGNGHFCSVHAGQSGQ